MPATKRRGLATITVFFQEVTMFSKDFNEGKYLNRRWALGLVAFMLTLIALSGEARAQDTRVGDTKDGCDGSRMVTFQGKDGQVSVKAGASKRVELPALTTEINWLCGGDRERSANDE